MTTATRSNVPQFSVRTLFALTSVCSVLLAVAVTLGFDLVWGYSGFFLSCAFVPVVVATLSPLDRITSKLPFAAEFAIVPLLFCILSTAFFLFGEAVDQPHPVYLRGNWVTVGLANFVPMLPFVALAGAVLVAVDSVAQTSRPRDRVYFPRLSSLRSIFQTFGTRIVVVIGTMLVLGYFAVTVIDVFQNEQLPAMIWPPKRVFVTCHFLWGILWLADCLLRPQRGTIAAAIGYLVLTFMFLLPLGFGVFRE